MNKNTIIITGGGSGMGAATAEILAKTGARLCIVDMNKEGAEQTASRAADLGGSAFATQADVTSPQDNERIVQETIDQYGQIDGLFLNAGIARPSNIKNGDIDDWQALINTNLTGPFLGLRAACPYLKAGSSVVITASVAGLRGSAGSAGYIASKHGVIGLMKAAAAEFARDGIRVNAVCPGTINTPMLVGDLPAETIEGALASMSPMRRVADPSEVGELVAFLLSDRASYITGQAYPIDGGMSQIMSEGEAFPAQGESITDVILGTDQN